MIMIIYIKYNQLIKVEKLIIIIIKNQLNKMREIYWLW